MSTPHTFGWRPDLPDHRDHKVKVGGQFLAAYAALPASVDLRPLCSPVENQGRLQSCTGNAIVGAMELLENKRGGNFYDLSRLFVYWNERDIEGATGQDVGAYIRDGIKVVASFGACLESIWPYNESIVFTRPTDAAFADAQRHRVTEYARVGQTIQEIKGVLAGRFPIVFGFSVYDSFESEEVARTGILPMPAIGESCLGGHAVLAIGYDDARQAVLVRNSWGTEWGQSGYFWMPYDYITMPDLTADLWTIQN